MLFYSHVRNSLDPSIHWIVLCHLWPFNRHEFVAHEPWHVFKLAKYFCPHLAIEINRTYFSMRRVGQLTVAILYLFRVFCIICVDYAIFLNSFMLSLETIQERWHFVSSLILSSPSQFCYPRSTVFSLSVLDCCCTNILKCPSCFPFFASTVIKLRTQISYFIYSFIYYVSFCFVYFTYFLYFTYSIHFIHFVHFTHFIFLSILFLHLFCFFIDFIYFIPSAYSIFYSFSHFSISYSFRFSFYFIFSTHSTCLVHSNVLIYLFYLSTLDLFYSFNLFNVFNFLFYSIHLFLFILLSKSFIHFFLSILFSLCD